ncbi:uncharacterized protein F4812DRAFT_453944 [Daldinia caldariorum]|uniref:uncharacterized protein n=1 Tax=Daldinia caldariorum TaxID=326644 RepID=UPI0020087C0B|nr:uncharacterized protein F4812DRAFT_453944 [Daldinia caldariorum]KAI1472129.1 hypothetical protein F4812DRAFT_453944 [Daldinia caldariorum]
MAQTVAAKLPRRDFGYRLEQLTTVFTPPCSITWLQTTTKVPSQYPSFPTGGPISCNPPSWEQNISLKGFAYYSPAICPEGFMIGCTANDDRPGEGFPAITAGETAMYCVPRGFTCTSDTTDFRGGVWGFTHRAVANGSPVTVGPAIQIRWRDADLSLLATDPLACSTVIPTPTSSTSTVSLPEATTSRSTTGRRGVITPIPTATATATATTTTTTGIELGGPPVSIEPYPIITDTKEPPSFSTDPLTTTPAITSSIEPSTVQPSRTSTAGNNGAAGGQEEADKNDPGSATSSTNTAAMALSGILISIILCYLAARIFRRYRRYRAGKVERFLPFDARLWTSCIFAKRSDGLPSHKTTLERPPRCVDAELGTDGPIPELGPGDPLGTKENPAELSVNGVNNTRNSWVSRVSRIFTNWQSEMGY